MPRYTIVYVSDDINPECFGTFEKWAAANARMVELDAVLDEFRDVAGGGAGLFAVCRIKRLSEFADTMPTTGADQ
jgi:hypothetical protein